MFLNISFNRERLLAPRPTHKLEGHPSSAVRDCLFNLFAATLLIVGRSSIRNLRTRHAGVTGAHKHSIHTHIHIEFLHCFKCLKYAKQSLIGICFWPYRGWRVRGGSRKDAWKVYDGLNQCNAEITRNYCNITYVNVGSSLMSVTYLRLCRLFFSTSKAHSGFKYQFYRPTGAAVT